MTIVNLPRARGRAEPRRRGDMNGVELEYSEHLEALRLDRQIVQWRFEAITFRLADDCRLTPDFMIMGNDGILAFHDVKGTKRQANKAGVRIAKPWIEEDAIIKLRVVAQQFPEFTFLAVFKVGPGVWEQRNF